MRIFGVVIRASSTLVVVEDALVALGGTRRVNKYLGGLFWRAPLCRPLGELRQFEHVCAPRGERRHGDDERDDAGSDTGDYKVPCLYTSRRAGDRVRRGTDWQMKRERAAESRRQHQVQGMYSDGHALKKKKEILSSVIFGSCRLHGRKILAKFRCPYITPEI